MTKANILSIIIQLECFGFIGWFAEKHITLASKLLNTIFRSHHACCLLFIPFFLHAFCVCVNVLAYKIFHFAGGNSKFHKFHIFIIIPGDLFATMAFIFYFNFLLLLPFMRFEWMSSDNGMSLLYDGKECVLCSIFYICINLVCVKELLFSSSYSSI